MSVATSRHDPLQLIAPAGHAATHAPAAHTWPAAQRRPHMPQWLPSTARRASQPLVGVPSQSPKPAAHVPGTQAPATHAPAALGSVHTRPHAPQLRRSVPDTATSQPLAGLRSQSRKPALHASTRQVRATHDEVALARLQAARHAPQFSRSLVTSMQSPSHATVPMSQAARHTPTEHT
jgi:hypothetical protein